MLKPEQSELFAKWLEGELTPEEQTTFEGWCKNDEAFADHVATAGRVERLSADFESQPVPKWDMEATFETPDGQKEKWWHWQGWSIASFATSMAAILLVTLRVEISTQGGGMLISFAGDNQQQISQVVNDKLQEYKQLQESYLTTYAQNLQQQQSQMNAQLTNYLLKESRVERKEDFAELIKFVNQQRNDDQLFYARQLNQLQQNIYEAGTVPAEVQE